MRPPHRSGIARLLLQFTTVISAMGSLLFWFLYFSLYWPYRNLFNEQGRYFDEESVVVHHEQSGLLIIPALALLLLTVLLGRWAWRRVGGTGGS